MSRQQRENEPYGFQDDRADIPSPERVAERAREIARIRGASADDTTEADVEQARLELSQQDTQQSPPDEAATDGTDNRDPSDPPARDGSQAPRRTSVDEQALPAQEARHGKARAEHDEMLEGQKRPNDLQDHA